MRLASLIFALAIVAQASSPLLAPEGAAGINGGTDPGFWLQMDRNPNKPGDEGYFMVKGYDGAGHNQKIGAMAFQWTNIAHADGYASWNEHASYMRDGTQADEFGIAHWGRHGVSVFPKDLSASSAPGPGVLRVNGSLDVTQDVTIAGRLALPNGTPTLVSCDGCGAQPKIEGTDYLITFSQRGGSSTPPTITIQLGHPVAIGGCSVSGLLGRSFACAVAGGRVTVRSDKPLDAGAAFEILVLGR